MLYNGSCNYIINIQCIENDKIAMLTTAITPMLLVNMTQW